MMSNITVITTCVISLFTLIALASLIGIIWDQIDTNKKLINILDILNETKRPIKSCAYCVHEDNYSPDRPCNKCQRAYVDCYEKRNE